MQEVNVTISRKVFNKGYLPYLEDDTRNQIFFGGASSGKSVFAVGQRPVYDVLKGGRNYLMIRNVARTSRQSTFNEIRKIITAWNVGDYFRINKSDMVITCANGYQILFAGLDDVEKLKSITPENGVLTDIVIEEATETAQEDIKQLYKRLRGRAEVKKRLTMVFNPILRSHWIHEDYFRNRFHDGDKIYKDESQLILKTIYKDNLRFLEDDDVKALEDETDEYFYNVYTLGNWGVLGDVIFTNWKVMDLSERIPYFDNIRNGVDFGFAEDPAAYNRIHYDKKRKLIYIFKELHEYGLTNPQLANRLSPIVGSERVICDSAEPKSIQELKDNGINAYGAVKGKDSINFGIQWLKQHKILIDRGCQETINEFQVYQWKKTRSGETVNVPVDKFNHHLDCFIGSTLVMTKRGQTRIDSLLDRDEVLTRCGYKKILWHEKTKTARTVKAIFSDGTIIECIKTHQFITTQNIKKNLNLLTQCDILLKNKGGILQWLVNQLGTMAIDIGEAKGVGGGDIIPGLPREKSFIFIGRFMKIIMAQFQRAMRFIMLMVTNWTMPQTTLKPCLAKGINLNTEGKLPRLLKEIWIELDRLQRHGIVVQKEESGILNREKKTMKRECPSKKSVLCVMNPFKTLLAEKIPSLVQTNVNQNTEENQGLIMKSALVYFVEKYLKLINMGLLKPVRVLAVTDTEQKKDVYNLQVDSDSHEYYANGILVGNCIRYQLEEDMGVSLKVKPRIAMAGGNKGRVVEKMKPKLKPGEEAVPIDEGGHIIGYEIIRPGGRPRGIESGLGR